MNKIYVELFDVLLGKSFSFTVSAQIMNCALKLY